MAAVTSKTVLVTGGNRGIGLELTRQLLKKGNTVVATVRAPNTATELQKLAAESGSNLTITQLDVAAADSIEKWAQGLKSKFDHFDLVINNAGVASWSDLDSVTAGEMLGCFLTNTVGPLLVTQQLHRQRLIGAPGTTIVANMTSKMGSIDDNGSGGSYAYRASKAALNIVNKSLSIDLQPDGITSVLLHPGYVRTDMTDWEGLIDTQQCASGLLAVLESGQPLNGRWYDYAGKEIPW